MTRPFDQEILPIVTREIKNRDFRDYASFVRFLGAYKEGQKSKMLAMYGNTSLYKIILKRHESTNKGFTGMASK